MQLKIHEFIAPDGALSRVYLRPDAGGLWLVSDDGARLLPEGALRAVLRRYGSPFDPEASSVTQGVLELPHGGQLLHVRHRAGYDVIARDYLVYKEPNEPALCAMATSVAGALRHLALAATRVT